MGTYNFVIMAIAAGLGLSLITGPIGCFLLWKRMAFFGDALSHSALLGVVLGTILHIDIHLGIVVVCILMAMILAFSNEKFNLSADAWLGIVSYSSLALGALLLSKLDRTIIDPSSYLFGEILAIDFYDLAWIYGCGILVLGFLKLKWRSLMLWTVDEDFAQTTGVKLISLRIEFMLILALVIAVTLKVVGALLVPALLIIPAAAAGKLSRNPKQMIFFSIIITALSALIGLGASFVINSPSGATIVISSLILFLLIQIKR